MKNYLQKRYYKYFDLSNPYAIQNLQEDIIHFSSPEVFNDPFDCFVGYNHENTVELLLLSIWLKVCENYSVEDSVCETISKFILNEKLLQNEKDYLKGYMNLWANEDKWQPLDVDYWEKQNAQKRDELLFQLWGINDNNILEICKETEKLHYNIKKAINDNYRISCFSESFDNQLMWAHYANKHKGICVEYDFSKINNTDKIYNCFIPVTYTKKRLTVPIDVNTDNNYVSHIKEGNYDALFIIKVLSTKARFWEYEKEWRIIMKSSDLDCNDNLRRKIVSSIYLGINISTADRERIKKIAKEKNILLYQMGIRQNEFKFEYYLI